MANEETMANEEEGIRNQIIETLLARFDPPEDKEKQKEEPEAESQSNLLEEELEEDVFYSPGSPIQPENPPELKTEKRKRITSNDVGSLLKDLDVTLSGGKPQSAEPVFGIVQEEILQEEQEEHNESLSSLSSLLPEDTTTTIETPLEDAIEIGEDTEEEKLQDLDDLDEVLELEPVKTEPQESYDSIIPMTEEDTTDQVSQREELDDLDEFFVEKKEELTQSFDASTLNQLEDTELPPEKPETTTVPETLAYEQEELLESEFDFLTPIEEPIEETITEETEELQIPLAEERKETSEEITEPETFELDSEEKESIETVSLSDRPSSDIQEIDSSEELESLFTEEEIKTTEKITEPVLTEQPEEVSTQLTQESSEDLPKESDKEEFILPDFSGEKKETKEPLKEPLLEEAYKETESVSQKPYSEPEKPMQKQSTSPPPLQEDDSLEFSDEELETIQANLNLLPEELAGVTRGVILEEQLPIREMKWLTRKLLQKPNAKEIEAFLIEQMILSKPVLTQDKSKQDRKKKEKQFSGQKGSSWKTVTSILVILIIAGAGLWFGLIEPYQSKQELYQSGLSDIEKGANYYPSAESQFEQAREGLEGNIDWFNRYAEKYIQKADPQALYNAHQLLLGNDPNNERWLEKYTTRPPGQESRKSNSRVENRIPAVELEPENQTTRLLVGQLFQKKALWAQKRKDWNDVNFFLEQSLSQAYQPILDRDPQNSEILNRVAKTYMFWGDLLETLSPSFKEEKYSEAKETLERILNQDPDDSMALYGLLKYYLTFGEESQIDRTYQQIQEINSKEIDKEISVDYADYLSMEKNQPRKAKSVLNRLIEQGEIYPPAYYVLGKIFEQQNETRKALESYIKSLLAYYLQSIGQEIYQQRLGSQSAQFLENPQLLSSELKLVIDFIRSDSNPENQIQQSQIFNRIGSSLFTFSQLFRKGIESERIKKENLKQSAKQNFLLALEKNPRNHEAWKNLGDLNYSENLYQLEFVKQSAELQNYETLQPLFRKEQFQKASESYLNSLFLLTNDLANDLTNDKLQSTEKLILDTVQKKKLQVDLFYQLGYIFYQQRDFQKANAFWQAMKQHSNERFNPDLNLALANSFFHMRKWNPARQNYQNVIDFYEELSELYQNNPDPNSPRQNEVFAKLARAHNNIGLVYHIESDNRNRRNRQNNSSNTHGKNLLDEALYHYYKAREYSSKLNLRTVLEEERFNTQRIIRNILFAENREVELQTRKIELQNGLTIPLNPLRHMLIEDIPAYFSSS